MTWFCQQTAEELDGRNCPVLLELLAAAIIPDFTRVIDPRTVVMPFGVILSDIVPFLDSECNCLRTRLGGGSVDAVDAPVSWRRTLGPSEPARKSRL